ncbi:type 2 lanthipeptide synthetase LanM family protein [Streptomyces anulatus]
MSHAPAPTAGPRPSWDRIVETAWAEHIDATPVPATGATGELLHWLRPLTRWAQERLAEEIAWAGPLPRSHPLFAPDTSRLAAMTGRLLVAELGRARASGSLPGRTPQERFLAFTAGLCGPRQALRLLRAYPALAQELVAECHRWIRARSEFAVRFSADLEGLTARFGVTIDSLAGITEAVFCAGDAHRNGRTVAVVRLRDGRRLVYKPRSLAVETNFARLTDWVNDRGPRHRLRATRVWERGEYGWAAHVAAAPCPDAPALERFYWRQGAFTALLHVLCAYDMHAENIVAAGEHPVFIDLEALFHAGTPFDPAVEHPAESVLRESVCAVGLLPQRVIESDEDGVRAMDLSGLTGGARPGELRNRPTPAYADPGTDLMRERWGREELPRTSNRPVLGGREGDAIGHADAVADGFASCYRLLLAHRDELLGPDSPLNAFVDDEVRVVVRDTFAYRELLTASFHPDLLGDPAAREDSLRRALEQGPAPRVAASELRQLLQGDIPVFTTAPSGGPLRDDAGPVPGHAPVTTGLASVRERLANLSEADLESQLWFVRAALCTRAVDGHRTDPAAPGHPVGPPDSVPAHALPSAGETGALTDAVLALADRLRGTMLGSRESGLVDWMSLNLVDHRFWSIGPSGIGLGSGITGTALFLAEAAAVCGDDGARRCAEDVVATLFDPAELPEPEDLAELPPGAFEVLGGGVHLLLRLADLWHDTSLLDTARLLVRALGEAQPRSGGPGLMSGAAGGLVVLADFHARCGDEVSLASVRATARALRNAPPAADASFAFGSTGIGYALAVADQLLGTDGADLAGPPVVPRDVPGARNGWCGGAASRVFAAAGLRLAGVPYHGGAVAGDLTTVRADVRRGLPDDSLCHGTLGLAEALRLAAACEPDPEAADEAEAVAIAVARRVLAGRARTGVPLGHHVPGLLEGAAGIGHGLLRAAAPASVPSVLLLRTRPDAPTP